MGGSQSQERVVTVEERAGENGDPQITVIILLLHAVQYAGGHVSTHAVMRLGVCTLQVTQDFLKYIQEQSGGEIPEGKGREPPPYPSEEEEEEEEEIPYISAEELVRVLHRLLHKMERGFLSVTSEWMY